MSTARSWTRFPLAVTASVRRTRRGIDGPPRDEAAIVAVMNRYAAAVDRLDFDGVESCFAPDARCVYNGRELPRGPGSVTAFLRSSLEAMRAEAEPEFVIHAVANVHVKLDGDRARAQTYVVRYVGWPRPDGVQVSLRGLQYDDRLVRTPAADWQIVSRDLSALWDDD